MRSFSHLPVPIIAKHHSNLKLHKVHKKAPCKISQSVGCCQNRNETPLLAKQDEESNDENKMLTWSLCLYVLYLWLCLKWCLSPSPSILVPVCACVPVCASACASACTCACVSVPVCLSVPLPAPVPVCLCLCLCTCLCPCLCLCLCLYLFLSVCLYPRLKPGICVYLYLSLKSVSVCLSVCLSVPVPVSLYEVWSLCLCLCLSVCLSVCLCLCVPCLLMDNVHCTYLHLIFQYWKFLLPWRAKLPSDSRVPVWRMCKETYSVQEPTLDR